MGHGSAVPRVLLPNCYIVHKLPLFIYRIAILRLLPPQLLLPLAALHTPVLADLLIVRNAEAVVVATTAGADGHQPHLRLGTKRA